MAALGLERKPEKKQLLSSRSYTITGDAETGTGAIYGTSIQQAYEYTYRRVGDKNYELANHLGNVLAVVTDRKLKLTTTAYTADVISYADYSPYGFLLQHRHGNDNSYRYGFQGQERDDEIKGAGNSMNYEYRMHDPRVGRFFAVDPLAPEYPELTPYQFGSNSPIYMLEVEGLEGTIFHYQNKGNGAEYLGSSEDPNLNQDVNSTEHIKNGKYSHTEFKTTGGNHIISYSSPDH